MPEIEFPAGFTWGVATAAYQVEGAVREDGRGESIWDRFSHTPGKTLEGDTGDVACDHYHQWQADLDLMQWLGLRAYRFSVAWSRILPDGLGEVNQPGLDWYDRLVDGLLERGIVPFATLYHWDLPQALQDCGGWASRETVDAFARFADVVGARLGDRVRHWITHNEPWVVSMVGHYLGDHAPGLRDLRAALAAAHHLLLSHGRAMTVLRARSPRAVIGITLNLSPCLPARGTPEDERAAGFADGYLNRWFLDPLFGRGYPGDMLERYGDHVPAILDGDLAEIAAPLDFLGVNYYTPLFARAPGPGEDSGLGFAQLSADELVRAGHTLTGMGWPVVPDGLREVVERVWREYGAPAIYVTENGVALEDHLADDSVHDPGRIAFLHDHLLAAHRAWQAGAPLRGYFVWSLLDNFEWALGYSKRFGLVHVDYPTQRRTMKESGRWYRRVVARNALPPPGAEAG